MRTHTLLVAAVLLLAPLARAADLAKVERKIAKEPAYQTKTPRYCLLVFGLDAKTRVWLVLDGDVLYVDRNGNGDLNEENEKIVLGDCREFPGAKECRLSSFPAVDKLLGEIRIRFVAH